MVKIDIIGKTFHNLTVINEFGHDNLKKLIYNCQCSCGNSVTVLGISLRDGSTKSCGCLRSNRAKQWVKSKTLPLGVAAFNSLYSRYRFGAKDRGYEFNLTIEHFRTLVSGDCHYCGNKPQQVILDSVKKGTYTYNGIDRVDNTKGYEFDNVVTCCKICNMAKGTMSHNEFVEWIKTVYARIVEV